MEQVKTKSVEPHRRFSRKMRLVRGFRRFWSGIVFVSGTTSIAPVNREVHARQRRKVHSQARSRWNRLGT
jgi:hypothetical protein